MDHQIATHIVRTEEDIVSIRVIGDFEGPHMERLLEVISKVIEKHGRYGTLIDTRQMTRMSPDTRKLVTEYKGADRCFGNAIFGDSLAARVVMTMAWRAIQLLNSQKFPAAFLKNEAEARAWLAARREATSSRHQPARGSRALRISEESEFPGSVGTEIPLSRIPRFPRNQNSAQQT